MTDPPSFPKWKCPFVWAFRSANGHFRESKFAFQIIFVRHEMAISVKQMGISTDILTSERKCPFRWAFKCPFKWAFLAGQEHLGGVIARREIWTWLFDSEMPIWSPKCPFRLENAHFRVFSTGNGHFSIGNAQFGHFSWALEMGISGQEMP